MGHQRTPDKFLKSLRQPNSEPLQWPGPAGQASPLVCLERKIRFSSGLVGNPAPWALSQRYKIRMAGAGQEQRGPLSQDGSPLPDQLPGSISSQLFCAQESFSSPVGQAAVRREGHVCLPPPPAIRILYRRVLRLPWST